MVREGARDCAPMSIGIAAWGLVAGVAMAKSGMGVALAIFMSILVYAGSAQVAAVPLIAAGAPVWVVLATSACVGLCFLVYSFHYRPYFTHLSRGQRVVLSYFIGDTNFAAFVRRFPEPRLATGQVGYFIGASLVTYPAWQIAIITGIVAGNVVPASWGLGFAGTMALLALACGQVGKPSVGIAALVAAGVAVATYGLPLRLNIVVGISAAVAVGVLARHLTRRSGAA